MEQQSVKPLGQKGYGTIPHLPGSRRGPGDRGVNDGQFRICCVKTPPDRKGDEIFIQEKLDGCLHSAQPVMTDRGEIPVATIVENQLPVQVLTYNEVFGVAEYKPIVAYFRQIRERPWLSVVVRSRVTGSRPRRVVCTDNHRFYREGAWVEARDLQPGDRVGHLADQLDGEARQIILGGLLGDSAIVRIGKNQTRGFTFGHSQPQWEYFEFKLRLLGSLVREIPGQQGGFPGSKPNRRAVSVFGPAVTDLILGLCEAAGKKQVSREWLDALLPLGLAIWYMDDGSCTFPPTQRPRAHLSVNAFSEAAAGWLGEMLQNRFGIANSVHNYKGCTLVLSADGTDRFFQVIHPYVPACMRYKLPEKYRDRPCVFDRAQSLPTRRGLVETEVLAVTEELPARCWPSRFQYDIEVADNHNYFAGHVLVHNSNVGVARINGEILAINRAGWRVESSSYIHHQLFGEWVAWNRDRFDQLLEEGERVMGEWLVLAHGTRYCVQEDTPVLFGDLTWRPAGTVTPGVELLAFDEFVLPGHQCRYWRRSFVIDVAPVVRPTYRIGLADGTEFIASAEHLWLTKASGMVNWTRTDRLRGRLNNTARNTPQRFPSRLCRLLDVWEPGRSWAAGYLAGVFDGEGSLYQGPRKDRDRGSHLHLVFSQKENVVAQQATDMFRALNVSYYTNRRASGTSGDVASYTVNGGVPETLRLLGHVRPQRLLDRLNLDLLGRMRVKVEVPVEHVEFLGDRELVAFTTTTRTFVANGFGSHNCLPHEPFVPFDLIRSGWERAPTAEFYRRIAQVDRPFSGPRLLHQGAPLPLEEALARLDAPVAAGQLSHGATDAPEGVVYRIERQGKVDFLAKYVRPEKVDGRYLFELDEAGQVRLPPVELPRSRFTWNRWPGKDDPESRYAAWSWAYH